MFFSRQSQCWILYFIYVFSGAPSVMSENKVQRSMADVEIVPDVIPIAPEIILQVEFPSGVKAELGNELTPTQVKDQPTIRWDADPDSFYTLCMTGNYKNTPVVHKHFNRVCL
uniref:Phosphatidylethanolamine-binding F40A3.3 n=1 Tax=Sipha flava TaxID=143950 RepID=A0A2S2QN41_9HEMI